MKRHLLFLIITLLGVGMAQAKPVDVAKAQRLALSFAKHHSGLSKSADEAVLSHTLRGSNGMATMYAFNVGNGFVIIAADDCARPVLAYSDESAFDYENGPENMKWFLGEISEGIAQAVQSGSRVSAEIAAQWKQLENYGNISRGSNVPVVGPLIQTKWNQSPLYNRYCPPGTPTGCVATAMAQIMKYWNHPTQGTGSHSYMHPVYGEQSADFGGTTYNWDIMPISLSNQSTNEEIDAVAILSYHCGVAVDMDYATDGSGAHSPEVPGDMAAYFSYAPEARYVEKGGTPTRVWEDMLRANLDQNMPIYYSGYAGADGGHAFICDGYDVDYLFHFNWGWGGADNGYFVIDGDDFEYSSGQGVILDMTPRDLYSAMPVAPDTLVITVENDESLFGTLSWVNPATTVSGATISTFDKVIVKRNGFVIHEEENVAAGASMSYTDKVPYFDKFEYSVSLVNGGMDGRPVYNTVSYGPYCQWKIVLSGGDFQGWNGGGISVRNGAGTETAFVTMVSSSVAVQNIQVALGRNSFIWVEPETPVSKVAFSIKDADGNVVFSYNGSSAQLEPGEIANINNGCGNENVCTIPFNLKAVAQQDDNTDILLTWESDVTPEFGYCIYRDGFIFEMSSEKFFLDENTSIGGHSYRVSALCSGGESELSNEYCANSGSGCEPPMRLYLTIQSNGRPFIHWETPEGSTPNGYLIYRKAEGENYRLIKPTTALEYKDNSSIDEGKYYYAITAMYSDIQCTSAYAAALYNPDEFFVEYNKTATPDGLVVVNNIGKVQLAWNYAALAESHRVYRDDVMIAENIAEGIFTDENVELGNTYCYKVTAMKDGVESESTNVVCIAVVDEPVLPCSAPTDLKGNMQNNVIHVEWTAPADRVPDSYALTVTDNVSGAVVATENITETSFDFSPAVETFDYKFQVKAVYAECESEFALTASGDDFLSFSHVVLPCSAPTDLKGNMLNGNIHVEWTTPADRIPDSYALTVTDNESGMIVASENVTETSFDFGPVAEIIDYKFQVKAVYAECESEFALTATGEDFIRFSNAGVDDLSIACQIYPNPTNGSIRIEAKDIKSVTVTNLVGQQVYAVSCEGDAMTLDLSQQQSGIYFVKIVTANGETTQRVSVIK